MVARHRGKRRNIGTRQGSRANLRSVRHLGKSEGQSILEFLLMLPALVGLIVLLVRVNSAIQVSIVNQQYARAQALFLAFNSPVYPELALRESQLTDKGYNHMLIGVSDNSSPGEGQVYEPLATTAYVARKKGQGSNDNGAEPKQRGSVRVRTTVTLCTQPNIIKVGGAAKPILAASGGKWELNDKTKFDFCGGPVKYE